MTDEPPICSRCGEEYTLEWDHEPTKYCHGCAHKLLDELEAKQQLVDEAIRLLRVYDATPAPSFDIGLARHDVLQAVRKLAEWKGGGER